MATAKDIAQQLGISLSAVSIALNGKPGISDETRKRVLDTAKELGYTKRGWTDQKKASLQFLIYVSSNENDSFSENSFFSGVIEGACQRAQALGYPLQMVYVYEKDLAHARLADFVSPSCNGLLLFGTSMTADFAPQLRQITVPKVVIDNSFCDERVDAVFIDNYYAVSMMMNHLVELGHRKICFVGNPSYLVNFKEREDAFYYVFRNHPKLRNFQPMVLQASGRNMMDDAEAMAARVRALPQMPTAFLCANDFLATSCIQLLSSMGFSVPGEVSVAGIDNISLSAMFSPSITTADIPKSKLGTAAVNRLIEVMEGDKYPGKLALSAELVVRGSTAAPK